MPRAVHVLMVEDSEDDAHLLTRELQRQGFEPTVSRVDTGPALRESLASSDWDVVISDHNMPGFSGDEALSLVQASSIRTCPSSSCRARAARSTPSTRCARAPATSSSRTGCTGWRRSSSASCWRSALRAEQRRIAAALEESQRQLRESQQLEAVGRLAGGVAHDFNNLVAAILSYADLILHSLPPGDPHRDDVEEIKRAGRHAAELTRQLVAFSRQQVLATTVLNLNDVVHDGAGAAAAASSGRLVTCRDPRSHPNAVAHEGRPHADRTGADEPGDQRPRRDAGRRHAARSRPTTSGPERRASRIGRPAPGQYVRLEVRDTGVGIAAGHPVEDLRPVLHDQGAGQGHGPRSRDGVRHRSSRAADTIYVDSEPGHGATFTIYLPRTIESADRKSRSRVGAAEFHAAAAVSSVVGLRPPHEGPDRRRAAGAAAGRVLAGCRCSRCCGQQPPAATNTEAGAWSSRPAWRGCSAICSTPMPGARNPCSPTAGRRYRRYRVGDRPPRDRYDRARQRGHRSRPAAVADDAAGRGGRRTRGARPTDRIAAGRHSADGRGRGARIAARPISIACAISRPSMQAAPGRAGGHAEPAGLPAPVWRTSLRLPDRLGRLRGRRRHGGARAGQRRQPPRRVAGAERRPPGARPAAGAAAGRRGRDRASVDARLREARPAAGPARGRAPRAHVAARGRQPRARGVQLLGVARLAGAAPRDRRLQRGDRDGLRRSARRGAARTRCAGSARPPSAWARSSTSCCSLSPAHPHRAEARSAWTSSAAAAAIAGRSRAAIIPSAGVDVHDRVQD